MAASLLTTCGGCGVVLVLVKDLLNLVLDFLDDVGHDCGIW
jgi:hypothetical protein